MYSNYVIWYVSVHWGYDPAATRRHIIALNFVVFLFLFFPGIVILMIQLSYNLIVV